MNLIKPNKLKQGDTIGIIAPAGEIDFERIENAKRYFESKGYKVKLGKNIKNKYRYTAGLDEERLSDLHEAFLDKDINAIICARGGYGTIRLIKKIDYQIIKNNPKIFCGYSDITALSAKILHETGLITFSGPMAQSDFSSGEIDRITENSFWNTLSTNQAIIKPKEDVLKIKEGNTQGILFGGNLATLVSLCGQKFIPNEKFIFFTEDLNEDVYKLDKYFQQLLNIEEFKENITGLILGDFLDCDNESWLKGLFQDLAEELDIPTYYGYNISHSRTKVTIPYGGLATLEGGLLRINY